MENSIPIDIALNCRYLFAMASCVPEWLSSQSMQAVAEDRVDHESYGLKPKHGIFSLVLLDKHIFKVFIEI